MEIQKIALASDESIDGALGKVLKILQVKQKSSKEGNEALKLLFQIMTLKGVSSVEIPNEMVLSLYTLLDDETIGLKSRLLATAILSTVMPVGSKILQEDMSKYKDKITPMLVRKLIQTSGDEKTLISTSQALLTTHLSPSPLRPTSIPLFMYFFRKYARVSLQKPSKRLMKILSRSNSATSSSSSLNMIASRSSEHKVFFDNTPLEWIDEPTLITLTQNFESILVRTPTQAARDPNATNLFSVLSSSSKPNAQLNDVDGQASRAFFSVLLDAPYLSEEQISHHVLLQSLEAILKQLYEPMMHSRRDKTSEKLSQALSSFLDSIYKYIARVMDQIKYCQLLELKALTGVSQNDPNAFFQIPPTEAKDMREARLSRGVKYPDLLQSICIRVLDAMCRLDAQKVETCWILLSRSCLALSGVETEFKPEENADAQIGMGGRSSSGSGKTFGFGSASASLLNTWHASLGVPAGLLLGFSTAFFYPATCSAMFFAPSSLLTFGTSPERLHAASALQSLSFVLDHLLVEGRPLHTAFCAHYGILPFSIEFIFRSYFDSFLSLYYQDPYIAFETFTWLQKHALVLNGGVRLQNDLFAPPLRLSTHINMHNEHLTFFECFYKILLKMLAWHGMSLKTAFETSILQHILTPYIHLELFHTLLDLPLLTCCMEMVEPEVRHIIMTTPNGGFNALAAASSLLTSVVFSVHQQNQQHNQLQNTTATMPQYFGDSGASGSFNQATSSAPPSPYSSGRFASISSGQMTSGMAGDMAFGGGAQMPNSGSQPSLLSPTGIYIDKYRSILNMILWNEGGVIGNLWEGSGTPKRNFSSSNFSSSGSAYFSSQNDSSPLAGFWNDCKITPRVLSACENAISSLEVLLKLIIEKSSLDQIEALVPIILDRLDKTFPLNTFQSSVQTLLINSLAACFEKYPVLIVKLQPLILSFISESDTAALMSKTGPISKNSGGASWRDELVMCLIWLIGKYASVNIAGKSCVYQVMYDYDEALELLAYEKMSILSMEAAELAHNYQFGRASSQASFSSDNGAKDWKQYKKAKNAKFSTKASAAPPESPTLSPTARLLLVLLASLTKLAARCLPLASRVKLCLAKLLRYPKSQSPPEAVLRWSHHCLNVLKYPSLAAHILDSPQMTFSENSSIEPSQPSQMPWQTDASQHASIVSDSMQAVAPSKEEELLMKDFSVFDNLSVNLASTASFHTDNQTSLSFLLHRIDYNLRMGHDGTLDSDFQQSVLPPSDSFDTTRPDDLQYDWCTDNDNQVDPIDSTAVLDPKQRVHPFAL